MQPYIHLKEAVETKERNEIKIDRQKFKKKKIQAKLVPLINIFRNPTASNWVFVWFCDTLWLNKNNEPTVSQLHWDFSSPSFYERKSGWVWATSGQRKIKDTTGCRTQNTAEFTCCLKLVPWLSSALKNSENRTRSVSISRKQQNVTYEHQYEHIWSKKKNRPALSDHLMRWQTAKSALSPVVARHTSRLHSMHCITVQLSPEPSWAVLPAGHQDANTCTLACE